MVVGGIRLLVAALLVTMLPVSGFAQEATLTGTVVDASGGVLPGVIVRAVHQASGNTIEVVTDERGGFRIPARIGVHRVTAELAGFTTVTREGLELAVGQLLAVNLRMTLSGVQESITVTGDAPLVDTSHSRPSGVVGPAQMESLPVNGRNFLDLTALAPGSRANAVSNMGVETRNNRGAYQLNVDGQQMTSPVAQFRLNPTFSREAIAEFEFLANRFDASQGRSLGVALNVITKSGTNTPSATVSGYFRNDNLTAPDFIQRRVLPYSNQQVATTYGGPIVRNKIHVFGSYEYEREPSTITYSSRWPSFNIDQANKRQEHKALVRGDYELSQHNRLSVRWAKSNALPVIVGGGATLHPSAALTNFSHHNGVVGTLTQIMSGQAVNEIKIGWTHSSGGRDNVVNDPALQTRLPATLPGNRTLGIQLLGYRIGTNGSNPADSGSSTYSFRDQFTYGFNKGGAHVVKTGGEFLYNKIFTGSCVNCFGLIDATNGPIPANIESLFPVWDDPSTWNVAALSPLIKSFSWIVGDLRQRLNRPDYAVWLQDDWTITPRLTLNLGVRYDLSLNQFANDVAVPPFLAGDRPDDKDNVSPRLGFAYSPTDRTVLRGGWGKYIATTSSNVGGQIIQAANVVEVLILNDGRPDFWNNPFNGPVPTRDQAIALGQQRSIIDAIGVYDHQEPYSYQSAIGVERQIGKTMAVSADFVSVEGRGEGGRGFFNRNINLSYNPATGANYPFTDASHRPFPAWGPVVQEQYGVETSSRALDLGFQKRLSQRWQASGTYTLGYLWDYEPPPDVGFPLAEDFGGVRTLSVLDQRHRAVLNGIWNAGAGLQLSGLYFYGSGQRFPTTYSGDRRQMGAESTNRLRPDRTIVPRNNFVGLPIHRVDVRLQRRFNLGPAKLDGMLEVFNIFNHANNGSYTTNEASASYGLPSANPNAAYRPRMGQIGFRMMF
jgi:outer membrane receptor protein involved in Fe transport